MTGDPKGFYQTCSTEIQTYSKCPVSYLCRWMGVPCAKAGGPGVSGMSLTVTTRTAVWNSSRQVGLKPVVLLFIRSTSRKAKQSTTSSSSALGKFLCRVSFAFVWWSSHAMHFRQCFLGAWGFCSVNFLAALQTLVTILRKEAGQCSSTSMATGQK